jgi:hypothetical protein
MGSLVGLHCSRVALFELKSRSRLALIGHLESGLLMMTNSMKWVSFACAVMAGMTLVACGGDADGAADPVASSGGSGGSGSSSGASDESGGEAGSESAGSGDTWSYAGEPRVCPEKANRGTPCYDCHEERCCNETDIANACQQDAQYCSDASSELANECSELHECNAVLVACLETTCADVCDDGYRGEACGDCSVNECESGWDALYVCKDAWGCDDAGHEVFEECFFSLCGDVFDTYRSCLGDLCAEECY